jgi:type I restriction enzyme, S subunit
MSVTFNLPKGWTETTFGAVVSAVSVHDKKLPRAKYFQSGRFPVVDQGQQFIGGYTDENARVISEDLPLLVFGDHTRAFKYLDQPFVPGADGIKVLKPLGVNAKWLYEMAHALEFPDKGYARHYQHLKSAKLFVPPLPEQRRIVAELDKQYTRLEAGVVALRRVQANLKRYRAAVLKAACEGRLVPTEAELGNKTDFETGETLLARILTERRQSWRGRGQYKPPFSADTTHLPALPDGWIWASPDQLAAFCDNSICAGPFGTIFKARDFRTSGVPIIFLRHVAAGKYLFHKPGFMDERKWHELFRPYSVFGGELLITKLGEPPGVCAIYPEGIGPAMVTPDVIKLAVNQGAVLPKFLMHYFNSESARRFSSGVAFGTTRLRLTIPIFRAIPVPLPSLTEQARIVAEVERRLSIVEELNAMVSANLQRTTRLRQSILQKAFTGKLVTTL